MAAPAYHQDEYLFTDEVLQKAKTARVYIEHLYKVQSQNQQERLDRCGSFVHRKRAPRASWLRAAPAADRQQVRHGRWRLRR